MPVFERDGIAFHYRDTGQGRPFVFQHGLGGDVAQAQDFFAEGEPGLRVVSLDCRGHGETRPVGPPERFSFSQFADDVAALMAHLGIAAAPVGGISMGAGVSLNLALRHPDRVRALVLVRPAWLDRPAPDNLALLMRVGELIRLHGAEKGKREFHDSDVYVAVHRESPDLAEGLMSQFDHPRAEECVARLERMPRDAPNRDRAEWRRIAVPTLILATDQDPVHPVAFARALAEGIPGAELRQVTPKGVDLDRHTAEVRAAIVEFLRAQDML